MTVATTFDDVSVLELLPKSVSAATTVACWPADTVSDCPQDTVAADAGDTVAAGSPATVAADSATTVAAGLNGCANNTPFPVRITWKRLLWAILSRAAR